MPSESSEMWDQPVVGQSLIQACWKCKQGVAVTTEGLCGICSGGEVPTKMPTTDNQKKRRMYCNIVSAILFTGPIWVALVYIYFKN